MESFCSMMGYWLLVTVGIRQKFSTEGKSPVLTAVFCFLSSLTQVANLACSISNNEEGVKLVRMSASQLEALCPQVRKDITQGTNPSQLEALCPQGRTGVTPGDKPQLGTWCCCGHALVSVAGCDLLQNLIFSLSTHRG